MNAIFLFLFLLLGVATLFTDPELFLSTVLDGAGAAASLCLALLASYAVWLGLMQVWEDSGFTRAGARLLRPLSKTLLGVEDEPTLVAISMNLAANLLGIGAAATPYGIEAVGRLNDAPDPEYSSCMFFVLNATSIQLIPTSVVGLRAALGSGSPADIILPTLLTTAVSTIVSCLLVWVFIKKHRRFFTRKEVAGT
ncbi:MAG: hypothetical protein IJX81_02045 [Clostridia bacterium]|nr:hypothetical protein [Clostridia bacterium]